MATLDLSTVELVSTLRAAPQNGVTSSQDYNDSWTESLADLASLAGFINDLLLPMLNGLISTIQPTLNGTPLGLEGRFIFSDTTDTSSDVFFDSVSDTSLSIADSLRILAGLNQNIQAQITTLNVEVTALQTALSSTNQNDIAQALQNFAQSLEALIAQTNANTQQIQNNTILLQTNSITNDIQNKLNLTAAAAPTGWGSPNVTWSESGGNVHLAVTPSVFEVGGVPNTDQTVLNLIAGANVVINASGHNVTISASGGGGGGTTLIGNIRTISVNGAATGTDFSILCNGTLALTLPVVGMTVGQVIQAKNIGSGFVTVTSTGNIDGLPNYDLPSFGDSAAFQWDGTTWWVF